MVMMSRPWMTTISVLLIAVCLLEHINEASSLSSGDIRLVGSSNSTAGRVEIFHSGSWGTVCDDYWDMNEGNVVCRQLGLPGAIAVYSSAYFGQGSGTIWMDEVRCTGNESRLEYCPHRGWGVQFCTHSEDAGVSCRPNATVQGVGSCNFDTGASLCGYVNEHGDDFDWTLDSSGTPSYNTGPQSDHTTGYGYYVYIETSSPRVLNEKARLVSPSITGGKCVQFFYHMKGSTIGQLNVYIENSRGTRSRVWQQVGQQATDWLEGSIPVIGHRNYKIVFEGVVGTSYTGDIALDDIKILNTPCRTNNTGGCTFEKRYFCGYTKTTESDFDWIIRQSSSWHHSWYSIIPSKDHTKGQYNQYGGYYAYIQNSYYRDGKIAQIISPEIAGGQCVEFYYYMGNSRVGELNVYIDDGVKIIISWQLIGYQGSQWLHGMVPVKGNLTAFKVIFEGVGGRGSYRSVIALDDIRILSTPCDITPSNASVTAFNISGLTNTVRLAGSNSNSSGRVEVFYKGRWGTICGNNFPLTSGRVVCRQLGFSDVDMVVPCCTVFSAGHGRILLDDVRCRGDEPDISMCSHKGWGISSCYHTRDIGVICKNKDAISKVPKARLNGTSYAWEGMAEVQFGGIWGMISDVGWDIYDADVFCRQAGFSGSTQPYHGGHFGYVYRSKVQWISRTRCEGHEKSFWSCNYTRAFKTSWWARDIAGAECFRLYLAGGRSPNEGIVVMEYQGVNGTICNDGWDLNDANVACRNLGYSKATSIKLSYTITSTPAGIGIPIFTKLKCTGREASLGICSRAHLQYANHRCTHTTDALVVCSKLPSTTPSSTTLPSSKGPSSKRPTKVPSTKGPSTHGPTKKGPSTPGPTKKGPSTQGPTKKGPSTHGSTIKGPSSKFHSTKRPTTLPPTDVCEVKLLNASQKWDSALFKERLVVQLNKCCQSNGQSSKFVPSDVKIIKKYPKDTADHLLELHFMVYVPNNEAAKHATLQCKTIYNLTMLAGYKYQPIYGNMIGPQPQARTARSHNIIKIIIPMTVVFAVLVCIIVAAFIIRNKRRGNPARTVRYSRLGYSDDGSDDEALLDPESTSNPVVT